MKKGSLLVLVSLLCIAFSSKAEFKGNIFFDENRNGKFDQGEIPIPDVAVSNGYNVITSGKDGGYSLPDYRKSKFIFISIPAGYKSSGAFFQRIQADRRSYSFGLVKFDRTVNNTRFIQITDTETFEYGEWIDNLRDYSANNEMGFIMHTGDICYEKGLKFHAENINTNTMGVPVFYCIGNHDLVKGDYGEQLFESLFGPVYYSFDAGNTHFIVTPMPYGDHKPSYTKDQVYEWMVNDLSYVDPSKNLVVFNHDLLTFKELFIFKGKGVKAINLNDYNLKAWIYGHWHINFMKQHGKDGPISVCASPPDKGGIDHSPSNFLVYDISENGKIDITPRYSYLKKHLVINAPAGQDILLNMFNNLVVSVNTYHSVSHTKNVKGTLINSQGEQKSFTLMQNSDWNWSAEVQLDNKWKTGQLKLIIESVFDNGETVIQERSYGILTENFNPEILKMQWIINVQSNIWMAPPVTAKGKAFVATIDDFENKACGIHAIDAGSGMEIWFYKTEGSVKNTICYAGGIVLATDHFGIAYALDENSGKLLWQKELGQTSLGAFNTGSVIDKGVYYTGYGNYLQAVDIKTGKTIWVNNDWRGGEGATHTMIVANDVLIAASNWRALYAHDIKTGKLLWEKKDKGYSSRSSSATWFNDTLYVASKDGIGLLNVHTGDIYKYFETKYSLLVSTKPLIVDNLVIMGTRNNGLVAFDRYNGEEKWKANTGDALIYSSPYSKPESHTVEVPPKLIRGNIVFGASDGFIYMVNPENGLLVDKVELGAPVFTPVTPFNNGFLITDFGGNVYSFIVFPEKEKK
ncbi:MAG: hypothetical protein DRI73_05285 [Bacteroidetes bacterium]|nr:MAG: hypothetical protein DRI73_05285 [Bacteroidota bacterium]